MADDSKPDVFDKGLMVNGKDDPDKVPDFVKYELFLSHYDGAFREKIVDRLGPRDDARLMQAVSKYEAWLAKENQRSESEFVRRCSQKGSVDYMGYVRERDEAALQGIARREAHYRNIIASLSETGKDVVKELIEAEITPNVLTSVLPEEPYWKTLSLEDAQWEYEQDCYFAANGRYPPESEEKMKKASQDHLAREKARLGIDDEEGDQQ